MNLKIGSKRMVPLGKSSNEMEVSSWKNMQKSSENHL